MKAATRIYRVTEKDGEGPGRLVRTTHPAAALRHVAEGTFAVAVASQDDLIACIAAGVTVEDATPSTTD